MNFGEQKNQVQTYGAWITWSWRKINPQLAEEENSEQPLKVHVLLEKRISTLSMGAVSYTHLRAHET